MICIYWARGRKIDTILWSLSGLVLSIGLLNAYSEMWRYLLRYPFAYVNPVLTFLFVLPYRTLTLRLVERSGLRPGSLKEFLSGLVFFYAFVIPAFVVTQIYQNSEDPALMVLIFTAFACALHVPIFAFGQSVMRKSTPKPGIVVPTEAPNFSRRFFGIAIAILGTPLVLTMIVQLKMRRDYRLFAVDAVLTVLILSLFVICRREESVTYTAKQLE